MCISVFIKYILYSFVHYVRHLISKYKTLYPHNLYMLKSKLSNELFDMCVDSEPTNPFNFLPIQIQIQPLTWDPLLELRFSVNLVNRLYPGRLNLFRLLLSSIFHWQKSFGSNNNILLSYSLTSSQFYTPNKI